MPRLKLVGNLFQNQHLASEGIQLSECSVALSEDYIKNALKLPKLSKFANSL
jgi:hypothetical protein